MSKLAAVAEGLQGLQREAKALEERLQRAAAELERLRAQAQRQAERHGPGAAEARKRFTLLAEAERRVREARLQLTRGELAAQRWLNVHAATGEHGDAAGAAPPPPIGTDGLTPSDAVYAAVHAVNERQLAGKSAEEARQQLAALLRQLDEEGGDGARYRMVRAWQGEQEGNRNAYNAELRDPAPDATYVVSGAEGQLFQYETDERGRTVRARTTLRLLDQPRSASLQRSAKSRKGGDADDDGGHLLANQFGGPSEEINVVPQDWHENQRGRWRALEREWRDLVKRGFEVAVDVQPIYDAASARPVMLVVRWSFRAREGPGPREWVKDTVTIPNDHAHGPRGGFGARRG
jgi:DNA/RNA non-specific endonuclease